MDLQEGNIKKIIWLASYPKSGNTWLRAFITALNKGEVDINNLDTHGIFSSRHLFDVNSGLDSSLLYNYEVHPLQTSIFNYLSRKTNEQRLYVKVHDAYTIKPNGEALIPTGSTLCAIYLIRNPLDIAASLANHIDNTIDAAIALMNNDIGLISIQNNAANNKNQFEQRLLNWSEHVLSWTSGSLPFPVLVIKYEDMLTDSYNTFCKVVSFLGVKTNKQQTEKAIIASSFEKLQQKEKMDGFKEIKSGKLFFRSGQAENWRTELTSEQINRICEKHADMMRSYGYRFNT